MIRHSTNYCPNCNAGFYVDAGILADDIQYRCGNCGVKIDIKMKWGKIKSISLVPTIKDVCKGHIRIGKTAFVADNNRIGDVGNVAYWKKHHGDNWKQAHDEWMENDNKWWEKHEND